MTDFNIEQLNGLSEEEKEIALKILGQLSEDGMSKDYNDLLKADWEELPVDIETFLTNDKYLGKAWKDAAGNLKLYSFWLEQLKKIFPTPYDTAFNTVLESGARGIGKSEIACGCICTYLMYRVLCMKNPLEYYHLKPTEKICFAFMNIKLALAEQIATDKFQSTILQSPWFMSKGMMTLRNNLPFWIPPDPISIIIGSKSDDVIGLPIFYCLDGDTLILTTDGICKILDVVDNKIKVYNVSNDGNIVISDECTVKETGKFNTQYEIELEDGTILKCTPNHRFLLKDGTYKEAQYLNEDDELEDFTNKQVAEEVMNL